MASLSFSLLTADQVPAAYALEAAGFPPDEAASFATLQSRQATATPLFLGAFVDDQLVGFVCATLTPSPTLTHASMSTHVPDAPYAAIHSVCVSKEQRRKGVASALLVEYVRRLRQLGLKGARLITHDELVPLYSRAGFEMVGPSEVVHGERPWFEMKVDFESPSSALAHPSSPTATAAPEEEDDPATTRNPGKPLKALRRRSSFRLHDPDTHLNIVDLFCPRAECRCLLLKAGTATFVRAHSTDFDLPALPRPVSSPPPAITKPSGYWSVSSPLSFENIGFSRNASLPSSSSEGAPTIKYLICADCDHGPLGWHDTEGRDLGLEVEEENMGIGEVRKGREFLLDVERVRYRVSS